MKSTHFKGASALLGAAFIYGSFGLLIREMSEMFGNNAQVAFRFVLAFIFLAAWSLILRRSLKLPKAAIVKSALLGVAFCVVVLLFTVSVNLTKISNSVFLLYAGSIITSLLIGTFAFKEKLTTAKLVAIGLALVGLAMYSSALLTLNVGILAALLSGVMDGVSNSLRKMLKGIDRNTSLLYQFGFASIVGIGMLFVPETAIKTVSFWPLVAGVVFALLLVGLGNLLLYGFQHFDVNVGTVILATELIFASIIGWVFFNEVPTLNEIIGGVVIFIASILSAIDVSAFFKRRQTAMSR